MTGRRYRAWSRLIHRFGYHYAPQTHPPMPLEVREGIDGKPVVSWYHWCHWCGLRGTSHEQPWAR